MHYIFISKDIVTQTTLEINRCLIYLSNCHKSRGHSTVALLSTEAEDLAYLEVSTDIALISETILLINLSLISINNPITSRIRLVSNTTSFENV
jgi:hypothetical protein